jgi:hypothetical protein
MRPQVAIKEQIRAELAKLAIFFDRMTPNHSLSWDPDPLLHPLLERQEVLLVRCAVATSSREVKISFRHWSSDCSIMNSNGMYPVDALCPAPRRFHFPQTPTRPGNGAVRGVASP